MVFKNDKSHRFLEDIFEQTWSLVKLLQKIIIYNKIMGIFRYFIYVDFI